MPLVHDELLTFPGFGGTPSRCRVRLFLPPAEAQESGYIALLTDDAQAEGTSITNAAETIAATVCRRFNIPPERAVWIEHYDFRHLPAGQDGSGHTETFARVSFRVPEAAGDRSDYIHGTSLGKPAWTHIDRQSVEILIGEPLP